MELDFHSLERLFASIRMRRQGNTREYAFQALGFPYSLQEMKSYIRQALTEGEALACRAGVYYRLADASGAEFWVRTRQMGQLSGVDVFFSGSTSTRFGLENAVLSASGDPLEGGFYGWSQAALTGANDPEHYVTGDFPTAFTVPDFARHSDLPLPALRDVQYAAFARGLDAFLDEEDFSLRSRLKIASQSFFPTDDLGGWVTFAGKVLDCGARVNGITGRKFTWAAVEAYGATLDVVVKPRTVRGTLVPGGYVMGHFGLMGRLL